MLRYIAPLLIAVPILVLAYVCLQLFRGSNLTPVCPGWPHLTLILLLIGLILARFVRHELLVHDEQLKDPSEVEALMQEARNVRHRLSFEKNGEEHHRPTHFEQLKTNIADEVTRLCEFRSEAWTAYQVLTLDRLLIDFLPIEDLKARSKSTLVDLEDYAEGAAHHYSARLYAHWDATIDEDIKEIESTSSDDHEGRDDKAEKLRADLRSLLEHVASYESTWAHGKTIVNGITIYGSVAVITFALMGLFGVIYYIPSTGCASFPAFGMLHWGFLGTAGALTSVLNGLRDSDEVEVGNTRGVQLLRRTILGASLGFVAGFLIVSIVAGGLITDGLAVPKWEGMTTTNIYLSIVWAVGGGMGFQSVFQRVRSATAS